MDTDTAPIFYILTGFLFVLSIIENSMGVSDYIVDLSTSLYSFIIFDSCVSKLCY